MTCLYNTYFATIWTSNVLSIPVVIVMLVWGLVWYEVGNRLAIGLSVSGVGLVWIIYLRTHGPRVLMRAAAWPAFCTGDYFPRTEDELVSAAAAIYAKTGKPPAVVGSGWAHFLYRRGPRGPRIFLHNFKGAVPGAAAGVERWRSGTTIAAVNKHLRARNLTFRTHPTMDYISLGAWFACSNHGNGGESAGKSSDALKVARVLDMTAYDPNDKQKTYIKEWDYKTLRKNFDLEFRRTRYNAATTEPIKYCVLDCEFHKLESNDIIQKRCIVVEDEASAAEWLNPTAHLRLLFLGKARSIGLGVQWLPIYDPDNTHVDTHFCSRWCNFFQVDIFSVIWGWYESSYKKNINGVKLLTQFSGRTERYHANLWMPIVWPWQTVILVLGGYRNFELFFFLPKRERLTGKLLWKLVSGLIRVHKKYGGRSEIRHGAPTGAICLDVSMNRDYIEIFKFLWEEFEVSEVAFHLGKWNDPREIKTYLPMQTRVMLHELGSDEYFA
jgi:hypothetical protein